MSSPFKTSKEFLEADGPIYSFGGSPVIISFFLVISGIILLWFIYASYTMKTGKPKANNPVVLSLLIVTSAFSLAESIYTSHHQKTKHKSLKKPVVAETISSKPAQGWQVPIATAGLMIASRSIVQRRSYKRSRRSFQYSSSIWESLSQRIRAGLSLVLHSTRTPVTRRSRRTK